MGGDDANENALELTAALESAQLPYAIGGALATQEPSCTDGRARGRRCEVY